MKNLLNLCVISLFALIVFSSCGGGTYGSIYNKTKLPLTATSNNLGNKVGTAQVTGILGVAAWGDAGIESASKKAGIKKVSHVDYELFNILGVYATYTVYVYGD